MDAETISRIESLALKASDRLVEIDGTKFSPVALFDPRKPEPVAATLRVGTLTSFAEYVKSDEVDPDVSFIHVESPGKVSLVSHLIDRFRQREVLIEAHALLAGSFLGQYVDPEIMTVMLQTNFVDSPGRASALRIVGNLSAEAVETVSDDGMSQSAVVKKGVIRVDRAPVPNPIVLQPYRTFIEVEQPGSPFVLRLRGGGHGNPPTCALFEADGGRWRIEAIANVAAFLLSATGGTIPIYA